MQDTSHLSLYYFETCPYCVRVLDVLEEMGLPLELRHVLNEEKYARELIAEGGIDMVPCLRITHPDGRVEWMYESLDIVEYLKKNFG